MSGQYMTAHQVEKYMEWQMTVKQIPELKAEVKRLREQNEYFRGLLDYYKGKLIDEHAEVLRLREQSILRLPDIQLEPFDPAHSCQSCDRPLRMEGRNKVANLQRLNGKAEPMWVDAAKTKPLRFIPQNKLKEIIICDICYSEYIIEIKNKELIV